MVRHCCILLLFVFCLTVSAQKLKTVEAEYTYYAPEDVTLELAQRTALDRAKIQALADAFGTIVSQYNTTRTENNGEKSTVDFTSIGGSEVKGEWIETIGEPQFSRRFEGDMLLVTCRVKGKVREIVSAQIDLQSKVLRNGIEDKFESDQFRNGDDLYLSFQSPMNGFLSVYLVDADRQAFCLLPYQGQSAGIYPIEANRRYLFFNTKVAPQEERSIVDEYTLTTERSLEHNQIYIIFSPNSFVKAVDAHKSDGLPRQLSYADFNEWLVKCRKRDKDMTVRMVPVMIKK